MASFPYPITTSTEELEGHPQKNVMLMLNLEEILFLKEGLEELQPDDEESLAAIEEAVRSVQKMGFDYAHMPASGWDEDSNFSFGDWIEELENGDTVLGYQDWVLDRYSQQEMTPPSSHGRSTKNILARVNFSDLACMIDAAEVLNPDTELVDHQERLTRKLYAAVADFEQLPHSVWDEDDEYPRHDWQTDAANGDTYLGYQEWVLNQRELAAEDRPKPI